MTSTKAMLGIAVWVLALYLPSISHPFVMWDDPIYVMLNPVVQNWAEAPWSDRLLTPNLLYPVPLPVAIYAAITKLLGYEAAMGIHLLSTFLHALNAILLFWFCRRLTASTNASVVAALIWASHPIMVESVAWATNLKELLMTGAVLGSLILMTGPHKKLIWLLPLVVIGLASKPTFAVVGCLLFLVAWREQDRPKWLISIALVCLGFGYVMWVSGGHDEQFRAAMETRDPLVTIGKSAGLQFLHGAWPESLQPYYPEELQRHDGTSLLGWLTLLVGVCVSGLFLWRRQTWSLGIALALMAWLPYSNLMPLPRFTADTYAYFPGIGLTLTLAVLLQRLGERRAWAGLVLAACLAVISISQISRWSSTQQLWGPLLGNPDQFALPYQLIAFEAHLLGNNERSAELLEAAWPQLLSQHGRPGFADNVYDALGRPRP